MRRLPDILAACLWLSSATIAVFAVWHVATRDEPRIASAMAAASQFDDRVSRARALLHRRFALRASRDRILADIRGRGSGGDATGAMLSALGRATASAGLAVVAVESAGPAVEDRRSMQGVPLRIDLRGPFAGFLRTLTLISREDPMLDIRTVSITSERGPGRYRLLFSLQADAYRIDPKVVIP